MAACDLKYCNIVCLLYVCHLPLANTLFRYLCSGIPGRQSSVRVVRLWVSWSCDVVGVLYSCVEIVFSSCTSLLLRPRRHQHHPHHHLMEDIIAVVQTSHTQNNQDPQEIGKYPKPDPCYQKQTYSFFAYCPIVTNVVALPIATSTVDICLFIISLSQITIF